MTMTRHGSSWIHELMAGHCHYKPVCMCIQRMKLVYIIKCAYSYSFQNYFQFNDRTISGESRRILLNAFFPLGFCYLSVKWHPLAGRYHTTVNSAVGVSYRNTFEKPASINKYYGNKLGWSQIRVDARCESAIVRWCSSVYTDEQPFKGTSRVDIGTHKQCL